MICDRYVEVQSKPWDRGGVLIIFMLATGVKFKMLCDWMRGSDLLVSRAILACASSFTRKDTKSL